MGTMIWVDWTPCATILTNWCRDEMDAISQTTFSSAFSWMKMSEFQLKFHWSLFRRVQLTMLKYRFRLWLGAVQSTSHYGNQWSLLYRRIYASLGLKYSIDSFTAFLHSPSARWVALKMTNVRIQCWKCYFIFQQLQVCVIKNRKPRREWKFQWCHRTIDKMCYQMDIYSRR